MSDPLLRSVFVEALDRPTTEERARYLDDACGSDNALRQRVNALLAAHDVAGSFLADSSKRGAAPVVESGPTALTEAPGDAIGRYKLLQQIGEGGCGVVYMAEQEEPVRRRVAFKIIKLGMDTKQVIARFEAERQALALMDHPNIAKVLDAGATETGRPYFVMELIRGVKITEFCDENKLSTEERLKLFIQVCQAIQHAHQKGVIHRDIKPSNILVTVNDGVAVPKVIDFGIAKAIEGRLTDRTLFTAFEQFIGTPAYMSPEQATMTNLDIDTRSDIYSLGVLLYELLTGAPPFDQTTLLAAGLDEMRRAIREKEPVRPSKCLSTMAAQAVTRTARDRGMDALKLIKVLRGDLDWIVMKCLEKDRSRRYETANGLAMDLRRHLNNEPVSAGPPGSLYRLGKAVRRNKSAFLSGLAIAVVLLVGSVISTWQAIRATRAEREENRLRIEAEARRSDEAAARQKAEAGEQISKAWVSYNSGNPELAENLLASIPPAFVQPDHDHAWLRRRLGTMHAVRGHWKEAGTNFAVLRRISVLDAPLTRELDILRYGPVLIELGDTNEYRRVIHETISQWEGAANAIRCERVCKACLTAPVDETTLKLLTPFYETCAQHWREIEDQTAQRWACTSLALFEYRSGNYEKALTWSTESLTDGSGDPASLTATGRILRAMAARQLNENADPAELNLARAAIDEALKRLPEPTNIDLVNFDYIWSFDWLLARVLLREADALYASSGVRSDTLRLSPANP